MSVIDCYDHEILGIIRCKKISLPIYRIHQDAHERGDFIAKSGNILIGGGGGEGDALVIDMDKVIDFHFNENFSFDSHPYFEHFWSTLSTYEFALAFRDEGWNEKYGPDEWITSMVIPWILKNYPEYELMHVEEIKNTANEYFVVPTFIGFPDDDRIKMTIDWNEKRQSK